MTTMNKFLASLTTLLFSLPVLAVELGKVTPDQLLDMQKRDKALVIDIRTPPEWQSTGLISDSYKIQGLDTEGNFDQDKWLTELKKIRTSPDQPIVLVCRSGNRSEKVGDILTQKLGMSHVYHLTGGIQTWFNSGRPLTPNCLTVACK